MKRIFAIGLGALLLVMGATGCGATKEEAETTLPTDSQTTAKDSVANDYSNTDLDLTVLSSTMIYSEVSNMMTTPENYNGKVVKMKGNFRVYQDESTGATYFACVIADATACCAQGLEFVLSGEHAYPDDYPELDSEITVTGVFGTYTEGEYQYCYLHDAVMS